MCDCCGHVPRVREQRPLQKKQAAVSAQPEPHKGFSSYTHLPELWISPIIRSNFQKPFTFKILSYFPPTGKQNILRVPETLQKKDLTGSERERFDALFEEYGVQPYLRYAIIVSKDRDDAAYLHYLCRYRLGAQEHEIITDDRLETADWIIFDYILFFEETDATSAFLQKHYPDITGPVVDLNQYR